MPVILPPTYRDRYIIAEESGLKDARCTQGGKGKGVTVVTEH